MTKGAEPWVKAGRLLCFSEGEYSDYGYVGHFLALVDITPALLDAALVRLREGIAAGTVLRYGKPVDIEDDWEVGRTLREHFLPELIRMGALMDIDCREIHLGSYGDLDIEPR